MEALEQWTFSFNQILSAAFQSIGVFFKFCFIGLAVGIGLSIIITCILACIYHKRNKKNDDSKVMYAFAICLVWCGCCLSMMITGGYGGALIGYRTVLAKEIHKKPILFTAPEAAEIYIIFGHLEKLSEMDCITVGSLIKNEFDSFYKEKRFPLYSLVIGTNKFADKIPLIVDKQLQLPEIANKWNQYRYRRGLTFGREFSSAEMRAGLYAALNRHTEFKVLVTALNWFIKVTQVFETYLADHPEYHGKITVEQLCDAQINFIDSLLDQKLWKMFTNFLSVALTVVLITCAGSLVLVVFWTKPQKD